MDNGHLYIQLTKANWLNPGHGIYHDGNKIHVWRIKVSAFYSELERFKLLLNSAEIDKILRYKLKADRQTRVISRAVLRILLGRYLLIDPAKLNFEYDQQKKLILQKTDHTHLHFNVSHSGDWILIAVSTNPIGVDLEYIDTSFTYQNLLNFSFNVDEKNYIETSKLQHQSFYKLWTRKEALLKATGKGLIDELNLISSLDGVHKSPSQLINSVESWQITSFNIDKDYMGSAAFIPVKTVLQFFNFRL